MQLKYVKSIMYNRRLQLLDSPILDTLVAEAMPIYHIQKYALSLFKLYGIVKKLIAISITSWLTCSACSKTY